MFFQRLRSPAMPKKPASAGASRADDERILRVLAEKRSGQTTDQIAAAEGVSRNSIAGLIHRVRSADLAESGEHPALVAAGYANG